MTSEDANSTNVTPIKQRIAMSELSPRSPAYRSSAAMHPSNVWAHFGMRCYGWRPLVHLVSDLVHLKRLLHVVGSLVLKYAAVQESRPSQT